LERAPVRGVREARGSRNEACGEGVHRAAVLEDRRVFLDEARAVMEAVAARRAALRGELEREATVAHRGEELGRELEVSYRIGDAEIAARRCDQRVRGLARGPPAHRPAFAAEGVGDRLIEEERVVMAGVHAELIAEREQALRRERADEQAERGHVILAS